MPENDSPTPAPHRRRPRYAGKNPRRFAQKYKELNPERYTDDIAKVLAAGKTPAGSHRPIMVAEILAAFALRPGEVVDGARVVSADLVPYRGGATFDLLTSGPTATYWANGILLASTLAPSASPSR